MRSKGGVKTGPKEKFTVVFDDGEAHFGTLVDAMPSGRKPGRGLRFLRLPGDGP